MPPHRLTDHREAECHARPENTAHDVAQAAVDVLAGRSLDRAAADLRMEPSELATAAELYHQGGIRALERHGSTENWTQLYLRFTDWHRADDVAANHLLPVLERAEADGTITSWWFIRKHPCWRLRLLTERRDRAPATVAAALRDLTTAGHLDRWWYGIYEPEAAAFGGDAAMTTAHALFHTDSRAILHHHGESAPPIGRRELSILLCATFLRAAGLEWYEQGDVWHRVTLERAPPGGLPAARIGALAETVRPLLLADTGPDGPLLRSGGRLEHTVGWFSGFGQAGAELGALNRSGRMRRGLRDVAAYHIIFHWNRLGLHWREQGTLAAAAEKTILHE